MNKKLLSTLLYISTTPLLAMHYPPPSFDQNAIVARMQEMQPITLPLQESSINYINHTSKWSALAGACAGLGAGYLILQNESQQLLQQPTEILRKIAIPTASTIIASGLGYYAGKSYATYNTQEKNVEREANDVISLHNHMITSSRNVRLSEDERKKMNNLPFDNTNNKLNVYKELPVPRSLSPITARVHYVQDTASKLRAEGNTADNLRNLPNIFLNSPFLNAHRTKAHEMAANIARIKYLNSTLSPYKLSSWANLITLTPEYQREKLQQEIVGHKKSVIDYEGNAQYELARLAALQGCWLSKITLASDWWTRAWVNWSTNHYRTRMGEHERQVDIKTTKDRSSSLIQDYQTSHVVYRDKIIYHNNLLINDDLKMFITNQGGRSHNIEKSDILPLNKTLLEYNNYLNHNNADITLYWIKRCFGIN